VNEKSSLKALDLCYNHFGLIGFAVKELGNMNLYSRLMLDSTIGYYCYSKARPQSKSVRTYLMLDWHCWIECLVLLAHY